MRLLSGNTLYLAILSLDSLMTSSQVSLSLWVAWHLVENIFVYQKTNIYTFTVKDEVSYLWKQFLSWGQYDLALKFAKRPDQRELVCSLFWVFWLGRSTRHKSMFFGGRRSMMRPRLQWPISIDLSKTSCLIWFIPEVTKQCVLTWRLSCPVSIDFWALLMTIALEYAQATQKTMLATWLLELYLKQLDDLDYKTTPGK